MDLYLEVAADQKGGAADLQRSAFFSARLGDGVDDERAPLLLVLASGIGGDGDAHDVSELVVSIFQRSVVHRFGRASPPALLRSSIDHANRMLAEHIQGAPGLEGVACTLVGATLSKGVLHWVSVGDGHLYLLRDGELRKVNEDHRYAAYLAHAREDGIEVTPEPGIAPDMLISALTGAAIEEIDCPEQGLVLRAGDRLVLASQVLERVGDTRIVDLSRRCAEPEQAVTALLRAVETFAGDDSDGAIALVVDVHDRDAESALAVTEAFAAAQGASSRAPGAGGRARLLGVVSGLLTLLIFLGAAAGTWYGLGMLEAFRQQAEVTPGPPPAPPRGAGIVPAATPGYEEGTGVPSGTGLTFGAPPLPGLPPPVPGETAASPPGSLTFGAPALPTGAAETPQLPVMDGFRDALASGGAGPLMAQVPAGQFEMGSGESAALAEEGPRRTVAVDAFALGAFEVTVAEYQRFAQATGRRMPDIEAIDPETTPVGKVTWDDAYDYARWLSRQTGRRYRLPSEAEWEYAAGGGVPGPFWWGEQAGGNRAHCLDCGTPFNPRRPAPVGRFDANPFGLYDTAGNVAEWVHDCWHPSYRGAPEDGRVWEGGDCTLRVQRGGGFSSASGSLRVQARARAPSQQALDGVGFRVARDLTASREDPSWRCAPG